MADQIGKRSPGKQENQCFVETRKDQGTSTAVVRSAVPALQKHCVGVPGHYCLRSAEEALECVALHLDASDRQFEVAPDLENSEVPATAVGPAAEVADLVVVADQVGHTVVVAGIDHSEGCMAVVERIL